MCRIIQAVCAGLVLIGGVPAMAEESARSFDLSYIPADAAMVTTGFPGDALRSPEMEMFPVEIYSEAGLAYAGFDPLDIVQGTIIFRPGENFPQGPPEVGFVIHFSKPHELEKMLPDVQAQAERVEGKPYFRANAPQGLSMYMPDTKTLIAAHDRLLRDMVRTGKQANAQTSKLHTALAAADASRQFTLLVSIDLLRPLIKQQTAQLPELPGPLAELLQLPDLTSLVEVQADMGGMLTSKLSAQLTFHAVDDAAAPQLEKLLNQTLLFGQQVALMQIAQQFASSEDPVEQAIFAYARRMSNVLVEALKPVRDGRRVTITVKTNFGIATAGIGAALLLPAVQSARNAARRMQSSNNLKQIGLALHNYHLVHNKFPAPANYDEDGKPLLSWRVHILPFIEQTNLYEQFRLDEPWDSEHNRKLIQHMPEIFRAPDSALNEPKTNYLAPRGKDTIFPGGKDSRVRIADVRDGTVWTIMALEVDDDQAVIWTKPDDFTPDEKKPLTGLGGLRPTGFNALFADGSVRMLTPDVDAKTFRAMLTRSGAEVVQLDD